jgi:quercetin dioxygenase-like cupin family protein
MAPTKAHYTDVEAVAGGLHFLRDTLDCENLGISVLACEPGWEGQPHDHADGGHEEVYVLVDGEATITVQGEDHALSAGDAIRVGPDEQRQIRNGDVESRFVIAGAP